MVKVNREYVHFYPSRKHIWATETSKEQKISVVDMEKEVRR